MGYGLAPSRLPASQSLLRDLACAPIRRGLPFAPAKGSKTGQRGTELSPLQTPLTLSCGWIRMLLFCVSRKTNPYCAQMRSKGSLRWLVGRNLRFNRADPPLHYGQPSPLRCALLSPQGLATLRGSQKPARWSAKGEPPPLSCPCRSKVALLRLLARIAPVAPQGIVAASATGGAPIPCPSEEGDYGESG